MSDSGAGDVLRRAVGAGRIPGAVFAAGAPGLPADVVVAGDAQVHGGRRREMRRDTPFDLASLTKVVATLPAVLRLVERGQMALDDRVRRFLAGFRGGGCGRPTATGHGTGCRLALTV
jgi:CubicO group peptidase (beta-lactamase class C family)